MGTIKQGILGGFNGKVGTVVGSSWKGISTMRSLPEHVTTQATWGQLYYQRALTAVTKALQPITEVLRLTFGDYDHKMSTFNKAVQINYRKAIVDVDGEPVVDYKKLVLSKGFLKCFDLFHLEDIDENGEWVLYPMNYDNSHIEYPGLILILNNVETHSWYVYVHDQPFVSGTPIEILGIPINEYMQQFGWVFVYDKSLGQVSENCKHFRSPNINVV